MQLYVISGSLIGIHLLQLFEWPILKACMTLTPLSAARRSFWAVFPHVPGHNCEVKHHTLRVSASRTSSTAAAPREAASAPSAFDVIAADLAESSACPGISMRSLHMQQSSEDILICVCWLLRVQVERKTARAQVKVNLLQELCTLHYSCPKLGDCRVAFQQLSLSLLSFFRPHRRLNQVRTDCLTQFYEWPAPTLLQHVPPDSTFHLLPRELYVISLYRNLIPDLPPCITSNALTCSRNSSSSTLTFAS
jgi:hypothetical protein